MAVIFLITTLAFAGLFGYSLYCLKVLREELKTKNNLIKFYKTYSDTRLP